jgi:hypothetical protein
MPNQHKRLKVILRIIYALLITFSALQVFQLFRHAGASPTSRHVKSFQVRVSGNVRNPGMYRAIEGTTQFEILKVAGIRSTSDLSMFQLFNQVTDSTKLDVGTREPVKIDQKPISAILEFFFGELSVIAKDGRSLPQHSGLTINPGDRVITEDGSQAEVSIGSYSRIDLDKYSELVFDKIGVVENDQNVVELSQKAGGIWYKVVYDKSSELMKIATPRVSLTIGGSGADFFLDIQQDQITVSLTDGLVLIEKNDGSESINLISGQTVTIYNDGRPFQITKLSSDFNTNDIFSQLSKEKVNYLSKSMPLNILICGTPSVFYVVNVDFQHSVINAVQIPPQTLIETFAQDIPSLGMAYLYGGPAFVSTFIERILNLKIHRYIVIDKNNLMRISNGIGGLSTTIDEKASAELNRTRGPGKLKGAEIIKYLSPSVGFEESRIRQASLIRNLYEDLRKKNLVPTMILAEQLLTNTESNFLPSDIIEQYNKFMNKTNWSYREHSFPVTIVKRENVVFYETDLIKCKYLFNESEEK